MNTLTHLGIKHGTDKATHHRYTDWYEKLFEHRQVKDLLEIGIAQGASLRMWREYFPDAFIVGLDRQPVSVQYTYTIQVDVANASELEIEIRHTKTLFDVIIDDGGHTMKQQQVAFDTLWPFVKPGGIYIIEDVHTSHEIFKGKQCPYSGQYYHHTDDALTTEAWVRNNFNGSNYARNIRPQVQDVQWWHNEANGPDDSITVAIFKKV